MTNFTREQLASIAHLARLALGEDEVPVYAASLARIIALVAELDGADTAGVEPMSHPLPGLTARFRPDEITEADRRDIYQRNAPRVEAGLYLVPRVIE